MLKNRISTHTSPLNTTGPGPAMLPFTRRPARVRPRQRTSMRASKSNWNANGWNWISTSKAMNPRADSGPNSIAASIRAPSCNVLGVIAKYPSSRRVRPTSAML